MIAALDSLFIGENFASAQNVLGKPQTVVFHQVPAFQWKQTSGLVITVITAKDGSITLIDETAAPDDKPTGLIEEDSRESGLMFNTDTHANLSLEAPSTQCKGTLGADCWEFHYDRGILLRTDFVPSAAGSVLREATLADPALLTQLHFDQ